MRRLTIAAGSCFCLTLALSGCGGSSVKEGVPEKVDFSKDYSPMAKPNMFDPKAGEKATAASPQPNSAEIPITP